MSLYYFLRPIIVLIQVALQRSPPSVSVTCIFVSMFRLWRIHVFLGFILMFWWLQMCELYKNCLTLTGGPLWGGRSCCLALSLPLTDHIAALYANEVENGYNFVPQLFQFQNRSLPASSKIRWLCMDRLRNLISEPAYSGKLKSEAFS